MGGYQVLGEVDLDSQNKASSGGGFPCRRLIVFVFDANPKSQRNVSLAAHAFALTSVDDRTRLSGAEREPGNTACCATGAFRASLYPRPPARCPR